MVDVLGVSNDYVARACTQGKSKTRSGNIATQYISDTDVSIVLRLGKYCIAIIHHLSSIIINTSRL